MTRNKHCCVQHGPHLSLAPISTCGVITCLSSFDSSIDQTLSASHGVKEELSWCETGQIRVFHEASTLRTVVIFDEVRQSAMLETERDSLTLNVLLPHHSNNLEE